MAARHLPPVSSPLADSGRSPTYPLGFGAHACKPKCYEALPIAFASQIPIMTSSATQSYRYTSKGIKLMAGNGKTELLARRIHLRDLRQFTGPSI
ncbi:hypothetical protein PGTUg99_016957 [Puccinia graminis f. sp. tritici]|uniref:Uncharacterized protein n=1 Tax=Puccinia graminis f. sp. tritici TaxID=56615 RepID=A0A5B0SHQ3_PUCGR|nr:hypothetical protein PGTUg99_000115 [Puccinia graminis f. sp. tritici]KAA1137461.1 hypothetical protein PGTUg99_016957 [Puccinia graminis f. sp. tritici]